MSVVDVRFEHYRPENTLGVHETSPRISWQLQVAPDFEQEEYEIELSEIKEAQSTILNTTRIVSPQSRLVPWPFSKRLDSREKCAIRVRVRGKGQSEFLPWSGPASLEVGLLKRDDWSAQFISAPWSEVDVDKPQPEDLFRKEFSVMGDVLSARLYVTARGVYEAEINGERVGDYFLAPGWTQYAGQLHYQTYDVTKLLSTQVNCLGLRVAEGWYRGRFGFEGGQRNLYGTRTAVLAQLEIKLGDGTTHTVGTDGTWSVTRGPIRLAELYDGEAYDSTFEIDAWSRPGVPTHGWSAAETVSFLPDTVSLISGFKEPARRLELLSPVEKLITPTGKIIIDFGQNLVGYVRVKKVTGPRGHKLVLSHAEVLENGELGIRPLRQCKATDTYTLRGDEGGESYEPRFTFHGFRYLQVDGWPSADLDVFDAVEAVVCHTDMEEAGSFCCSDQMVNQLFSNTKWSMRGNFLSIPTDCPQRDERLGWTGDLALFAPAATLIYNCFNILRDWLRDVAYDQKMRGGVPPMVSPDILQNNPFWGVIIPGAIWHDVTVLAPWALWEETGDTMILSQQYESMVTWLDVIPRNKTESVNLWDFNLFQLADWLDPNAPPEEPFKAVTEPSLVANAFLIHSVDLVAEVAAVLGYDADVIRYRKWAEDARNEFRAEYVSANGRLASESQTGYALSICFDLLEPSQLKKAGTRLVDIVRKNSFRIGTGFAGTPYVCEALTKLGYVDIAYKMLRNEKCPSWLYPITMGATTIWERWDSMRPNGSINPGDMTSFNHFAYGAIAKFMVERIAGLQRLTPGWTKSRFQPFLGGGFKSAETSHITPYGKVSVKWSVVHVGEDDTMEFRADVEVPPMTSMEIYLPGEDGGEVRVVGSGIWSFTAPIKEADFQPAKEPAKPFPFNLMEAATEAQTDES
ncbi:hypothetical protein jhhlp_001742 [Lomentospora prolificans]|uniref:alpha-L-rhamnosidase n=1 Tax=Lomentospora prolificans TaxID=41688 RepID=A0A2N3NH42_9PEZI|nr:hypothetical protein jhhlp_001742 [Lomentospora prolificans]